MLTYETSHAYSMLPQRSRRVLAFVIAEIERQGGGRAVVYVDQLETVGSRRVYRVALSELHAVGLLNIERQPKKYICALWRDLTRHEAMLASATARAQPMPPQSAPASTGARA